MTPAIVLKSVVLFVLAGLCEIGGGYLVWLWLRDSRGVLLAARWATRSRFRSSVETSTTTTTVLFVVVVVCC